MLIGNANYEGATPLRNTIADLRALEKTLYELGFDSVQRTENLTLRAMKASMREFVFKLSGGDLAFFYFSGHIVQVDDKNYLLPVDFEYGTLPAEAPYVAYPASRVRRTLRDEGVGVSLMVLDPNGHHPYVADWGQGQGLAAATDTADGEFVVHTTRAGDVAKENTSGDLSLYMIHLLRKLKGETVELKEAFDQTRAAVSDAATLRGETWLPAHYGNLLGKVYLRGKTSGPELVDSSQPLLVGDVDRWNQNTEAPVSPQRISDIDPAPDADPGSVAGGSNQGAAGLKESPGALLLEEARAALAEAKSAGTAEAVEDWLAKFGALPDADDLLGEARRLRDILLLQEAALRWEEIKQTENQKDLLNYMKSFEAVPAATGWVQQARNRLGGLRKRQGALLLERARAALAEAKSAGAAEAVEDWLAKFGAVPGADELVLEARGLRDELQLQEAELRWGEIKQTDNEKDLLEFIKQYQAVLGAEGWVRQARERLDKQIERQGPLLLERARAALAGAKSAGAAEAVEDWLAKFGAVPGVDELVLEARGLRDELQLQEAELRWGEIKQTDNEKDLLEFIKQYQAVPGAEGWVRQARERLDDDQRTGSVDEAYAELVKVMNSGTARRLGEMAGELQQDAWHEGNDATDLRQIAGAAAGG